MAKPAKSANSVFGINNSNIVSAKEDLIDLTMLCFRKEEITPKAVDTETDSEAEVQDVKPQYQFKADILNLVRNQNNKHLKPGDIVYCPMIPIALKQKKSDTTPKSVDVGMWELGGKSNKHHSALGCTIAGRNNEILNGTFFQKPKNGEGIKANARQALPKVYDGCNIYVAKVTSQSQNSLNAQVAMVHLVFIEVVENHVDVDVNDAIAENKVKVGSFKVIEIFTEADIKKIIKIAPARRLYEKLTTINVIRPYYINSWSPIQSNQTESNVWSRSDIDTEAVFDRIMKNRHIRFRSNESTGLIDAIEQAIVDVSANNQKSTMSSSLIIQILDFEQEKAYFCFLPNLAMQDFEKNISNCDMSYTYSIPMKALTDAFNPNIIFGYKDLELLEEQIYTYSPRFTAVKIDSMPRCYMCLRTSKL